MPRKWATNRKPWVNPVNDGLIDFLNFYPEQKLEKALKFFKNNYEMSKNWRLPYRNKWIKWYQMYRSYCEGHEKRPSWQSSIFIPKPFEIVETIIPRLCGALYDMPPLMVAIPREEKYDKESRIVETLLDTRAEQTNQFMTDYTTFKEMLIYGTAWQKLFYDYRRDYEGTRWQACDIFDVYPDPFHAETEEMRFIIHREVKHIDELMLDQSNKVITGVDKLEEGGSSNYFSNLDRQRYFTGYSSKEDVDKEYHEIFEYHGKWWDSDSKESFDVSVIIADRSKFLKFKESQYYIHDKDHDVFYALKPFVKFTDVPDPHSVYGIGEIEVVEKICLALNDQYNMKADAIQMAISPTYQAVIAGLEDPDRIVFAPNSIIPVNPVMGGDVIRPIQKDMAWTSAYQEEESIKQTIRDATGIQHPLTGSEGSLRKTAREAIQLLDEANERVKMKLRIIEISGLAPRAKMQYLMEHQFTDKTILAHIYENDKAKAFMKIDPQKMVWDGILKLQAASLYGHKGIIADRRMRLAEIMGAMPGAETFVDWSQLAKYIAESLDIPPDRIIIKPKQPKQTMPPNIGQGMPPMLPPGMQAPPMPGEVPMLPGLPQAPPLVAPPMPGYEDILAQAGPLPPIGIG